MSVVSTESLLFLRKDFCAATCVLSPRKLLMSTEWPLGGKAHPPVREDGDASLRFFMITKHHEVSPVAVSISSLLGEGAPIPYRPRFRVVESVPNVL